MNISTAIRNLPEPPTGRRRRRFVLAAVAIVFGAVLIASGTNSGAATPVMLGVSLVLLGLIPLLQVLGVSPRAAYTLCGSAIVVLLMLPWNLWDEVFGKLAMDFSTWIVAGLMVVVGASGPSCSTPTSLLGRRHGGVFGRIRSARAGAADVDGVSARGALSQRHDARDVHARRVHARDGDRLDGLVRARLRRRRRSAAASRCARARPAAPIGDMAAALSRTPGVASGTSRGRQPVGAGRGGAQRHRAAVET